MSCLLQTCLAGKDDEYALCNVSKSLVIQELPKILVLHIKRFYLEPVVRKDNEYVSFTKILNMAPYCTTDCIQVCIEHLLLYLDHSMSNALILVIQAF